MMKLSADIQHERLDKADRTGLRQVGALIKEIEIIEEACVGSQRNNEESKLDEFQRYKMDLNVVLTKIKQDIKTKDGIEQRIGTNSESIKLKNKITKELESARKLQTKMESAFYDQQRDVDNGDNYDLSMEELKSRQELMSLMKQDLEYVQQQHEPSMNNTSSTTKGFDLASRAMEKRRRRRRSKNNKRGMQIDDDEIEPVPLTAKQQAFIQESIERDAVFYEKLDVIHAGVKQLRMVGYDITEELNVQNVMLDEMGEKIEGLTEKLESRNEQIKNILDSNGGASRWCPILIMVVILLACLGYIYEAFFV